MKTWGASLLVLLLLAGPARADSMLEEGAAAFFTPRCPRVGDLVTVVIADEMNTVQSVTTSATSDTRLEGPLGDGLLSLLPPLGLKNEGTRKRQETAATRTRFQDTVTARVVAVEPGDVLVLAASRVVDLDGQRRTVQLKGRVRARDVGPDNTVPSTLVADAVVQVEGLHSSPTGSGLFSWFLGLFR